MPINRRETGKDRWSRVPKDYFKKGDGIQKAKLRLSGLACVLALGWWATGFDWAGVRTSNTDLNSLRANHGELARVHATWQDKCDACHEPFKPIDGRGLFASDSSAADRSSDKLCMACHAGPAHHLSMKSSEVKACAGCHRDHQGRDFSMVRLVDGECTSCHESLAAHVDTSKKPAGSRMFGDVKAFNVPDHPPFQPEAAQLVDGKLRDKGRLKFNHGLHMTPGIVRHEGETPYTVERIPVAAERARYQQSGQPGDPVRLDCSSCHSLDSSEPKAAPNPAVSSTTLPVRASGRYYLPVNYETQCRACHTLTFDPRPGLSALEAPHGVQPDRVIAFLRRVYSERAIGDDPGLLNRKVTAIPLPGKRPVESTAGKLLDEAVTKATRSLFENRTSCLECHTVAKDAQGLPTRVEPTQVPQVWFTHAAFDHNAHRGVSCRDCHPRSYALEADGKTPLKDASVAATDVLIPAIDNCVQCHAPARREANWLLPAVGETTGGASFDCTECHRYHNGDNPLQGDGALAQDAARKRSIVDFMTGSAGPPRSKPGKP